MKNVKSLFHHYFDLDAQEIYYVCDQKLPTLQLTIKKIIHDLE